MHFFFISIIIVIIINFSKKPDGVVPPNAPVLDTPEKIQAWIEARKKNWPSKANVERKVK